MNYYGSLCTQIYDLDKPIPPQNELNFFLKYIENKNMHILEPMCGSGRFLIPILERGYNIEGFDISEDMLLACRKKAEAKSLHCHVTKMKVEEFSSDKEYDLIIIPAGSFCVITEKEKLVKSLQNFHKCLKSNGKLVMDILTPAFHPKANENWVESNRKVRSDGKEIIQYSKSLFNEALQLLNWPLKYDLVDNGEVIETEEMELSIKLYSIEELRGILSQVGFVTDRVVRNYSEEEATDDDRVVIFEVSKV